MDEPEAVDIPIEVHLYSALIAKNVQEQVKNQEDPITSSNKPSKEKKEDKRQYVIYPKSTKEVRKIV